MIVLLLECSELPKNQAVSEITHWFPGHCSLHRELAGANDLVHSLSEPASVFVTFRVRNGTIFVDLLVFRLNYVEPL